MSVIYIETPIYDIDDKVKRYASYNGVADQLTIASLMELYIEDKQFREAVENNYALCDYDRWKHFQNVIGTDKKKENFLQINNILWEEDIEVLELPYTAPILHQEVYPCDYCKKQASSTFTCQNCHGELCFDCYPCTDETPCPKCASRKDN